MICILRHQGIFFKGKRCPLCELLAENRRMKSMIEEMKIEAIFRDAFDDELNWRDFVGWQTPIVAQV